MANKLRREGSQFGGGVSTGGQVTSLASDMRRISGCSYPSSVETSLFVIECPLASGNRPRHAWGLDGRFGGRPAPLPRLRPQVVRLGSRSVTVPCLATLAQLAL